MYEQEYILLQLVLGVGAKNAKKILSIEKSVKEILSSGIEELKNYGLTKGQLNRFCDADIKLKAEQIYNYCQENNIKILPYASAYYPKKLMALPSPPVLLYALGDMPNFDREVAVSVIGPRDISDYGKRSAFSLSARLALGGALVVSGGAVGGDYYAHLGALSVGAKTVVVSGGGVTSGYLKANKTLREKVVKYGGVIVSEFEPSFTPRYSSDFYLRNRIIAGLADAVAVVEAPQKSGTLITAHAALDNDKEVFAFCGKAEMKRYEGVKLLLDEGATLLKSPEDILKKHNGKFGKISLFSMGDLSKEELKRRYDIHTSQKSKKEVNKTKRKITKPKPVEALAKAELPANLSEIHKLILSGIDSDGIYIDTLADNLGIESGVILSELIMLEIEGLVEKLPGSRIRKKF